MLKSIYIHNFALIDDLKVDFTDGFQVITGETGAGKSILLDALSLVLGKRADMSVLRDKEDKCIVEAEINIEKYDLHGVFEEIDIDYDSNTILRREILPSEKSRAFINDTPATLTALTKLTEKLIDIHSQHQTLLLNNPAYQIGVVDVIAGNKDIIKKFAAEYKKYNKEKGLLDTLIEQQKSLGKEYEYNKYLLDELNAAPLQKGIQEELEEIYEQAYNAEDIKERLGTSYKILSDDEIGIIANLQSIRQELTKLSKFGDKYKNILDRVGSVVIELDDINAEITNYLENTDSDPSLLQTTNDELQVI